MTKPSTPRSAWLLLAFLTLLNVVNFVDRQLITSLQVPMREELGLSPLQITVLAGYAFAGIYALAGLLLGTVADRWHRPRLIALGLKGADDLKIWHESSGVKQAGAIIRKRVKLETGRAG